MKENNKNICFVVTNMKSGGLQRNASILANHFDSVGNKVFICCLYSIDCFFELNKGVEIIDLTTNKRKIRSLSIWKKSLRDFFDKNNIDSVVSFGERCGIVTASAIKKRNINHICRGVNTNPKFINKLFLNLKINNIDHFVFQTNAQKNIYNKKMQNKGVVISNPFKLYDKCLNTGEGNKRFVSVASYKINQKRQDIMVQAFAKFYVNHPDYSLELYGEVDNNTASIENLINKLNLKDNVRIMGEKSNVKELIVNSRAFICTSTYEGMPNAMIEALALGIPVITTDWNGYDEIINDKVNGLVCKMNDVDQISNAMALIADNDNLFNSIKNNAWHHIICNFNFINVFKKWDEII